ncbi:Uroporphyrinogen-III synthase [Campylobacter concisus UNSWCS]|uniref:Uroporphyrinogen-III synthase n=1 Tax=Campylobacter concisus UNSWCS TaxID=1242968 RepID=U2EV93_9BACT|nr:uroporphyrinogen-III synthase [Campylobacter concisus]ERJ28061.1 Uroporphyrinogen-III synthase [Campylobacter concisus UNSWCS]
MRKIYLVSNTKTTDESVINLSVSKIEFLKFEINLSEYDALVATSKNAFKALKFNEISALENLPVFAIANSCAAAAREFGFSEIYTGQNAHGDDFAREILPLLKGKKVLYLKGKDSASNFLEILQDGGVNIKAVIAYENVLNPCKMELKPPKNSILIFASPINVRNFLANFGWDESYQTISIGKVTAKELKFSTPLVSQSQDINACIALAKTLL